MTLGQKAMAALAAAAAAAWFPLLSQSRAGGASAPGGLEVVAAYPEAAQGRPGEVVREINDPHTGDHWALERDPVHPEGPGRLVLLAGPGMGLSSACTKDPEQPAASSEKPAPPLPVIHPVIQAVIQAGDELMVEEHSAVVEIRLQAVALGPAAQGAVFKARLKLGGKVVRAVAISAGHAVFAPEDEVQP